MVTDRENDRIRTVKCPTCKARAGDPCTITSAAGLEMRLTHLLRQRAYRRREAHRNAVRNAR